MKELNTAPSSVWRGLRIFSNLFIMVVGLVLTIYGLVRGNHEILLFGLIMVAFFRIDMLVLSVEDIQNGRDRYGRKIQKHRD